MPQAPDWTDWRQALDTGMQFSALTRAEAQRRAQKLVREGQLAQERVQTFVDDLVHSSRDRADALVEVVRREIQRQVETLGIATKRDLAHLEARVRKAEKSPKSKASGATGKQTNTKTGGAKKRSGARKPGAKKKAESKKPARAS